MGFQYFIGSIRCKYQSRQWLQIEDYQVWRQTLRAWRISTKKPPSRIYRSFANKKQSDERHCTKRTLAMTRSREQNQKRGVQENLKLNYDNTPCIKDLHFYERNLLCYEQYFWALVTFIVIIGTVWGVHGANVHAVFFLQSRICHGSDLHGT